MHQPQADQRHGITFPDDLVVPAERSLPVLRRDLLAGIHEAQQILRFSIPPFRRLAHPEGAFRHRAVALQITIGGIEQAQLVLSFGVAPSSFGQQPALQPCVVIAVGIRQRRLFLRSGRLLLRKACLLRLVAVHLRRLTAFDEKAESDDGKGDYEQHAPQCASAPSFRQAGVLFPPGREGSLRTHERSPCSVFSSFCRHPPGQGRASPPAASFPSERSGAISV